MAEEEEPLDPSVSGALGGTLGAVPPPPRPSEESAVFTDASRDLRHDAGGPQEPPLARVVSWVRWAAAPLGFFVFLAALTAFGLLKDNDPATDVGDEPAANVGPATPVPTIPDTTTPDTAVTTEVPTTVAEPPTTAAPPPTEPPPTEPPPPPPAAAPPARNVEPAAPASASRFGPSCGYRPGQTVRITINGRPAGTAIADGRGCVTVR